MATKTVGAGILNIITESLYDKPIVVFREYAQNSVDSFDKIRELVREKKLSVNLEKLESRFWLKDQNLYFLDNGKGIDPNEFQNQMKSIGHSTKKRSLNKGYKGIGRLSGISYCKKLIFVNICSFKSQEFQSFTIDCQNYNQIKNSDEYSQLSFDELMLKIGLYDDKISIDSNKIEKILNSYQSLFEQNDTGFLVIMDEINFVLSNVIQEKNFINDISWLLPVNFQDELLDDPQLGPLFSELSASNNTEYSPANFYNFYYNNSRIVRPISLSMIRPYTCRFDLKYAIGFINFSSDRIAIIKGNSLSGIRIYIDNILLCDENEFLPILSNLGLIDHSANELIQSVRGIGAIIYVTDKTSISTNARRTFIEITDAGSIEFLTLLAEFVKKIYSARYALSKYTSLKNKIATDSEISKDTLENLKTIANQALSELAKEKIVLNDQLDPEIPFQDLSLTEKKQIIRKFITKQTNDDIRDYLKSVNDPLGYTESYEDYVIWVSSKYKH